MTLPYGRRFVCARACSVGVFAKIHRIVKDFRWGRIDKRMQICYNLVTL